MTMPFKGAFRISSPYGMRSDPLTGADSWHGGVDLVGADSRIFSVCGGTVMQSRMVTDKSNRTWEWGNYVSVRGDDGRQYYYCHLASRLVKQNARVEEGQQIGIMGSTGLSTGPHLHFEVRTSSGTQIDPCAVIGIRNAAGFLYEPRPDWYDQAHDWSREAVGWAVDAGILRGKGGGDLALGDGITREEFVVMLYRAFGEK